MAVHSCFFSVDFVGSGMLRDVLPAKSFARSANRSLQPTGARKFGDQLKTWMTLLKEDLARLSGPDVYGLRRWNRDWMTSGIVWAQDRRAWAAAIRDATVAMDAGATAPR